MVLVSGGSRGIGLMIARGFVEADAKGLHLIAQARVCGAVVKELGARLGGRDKK